MENKILTYRDDQGEFMWTRDQKQAISLGLKKFEYVRRNASVNPQGLIDYTESREEVYCGSILSFYRLLSSWNRVSGGRTKLNFYHST
jgi:hypothetical protein